MTEKKYRDDDAVLKLENQLCFAVYACSREIIKRYRPHLDALGITYTQYITMMVLWEETTISAKVLGERLLLDSGTLTPLLKKLEKQGYITRQRSDEDERLLMITLTDAGQALKTSAAEIPYKIACDVGLELTEGIALREKLKQLTKDIREGNCEYSK
ncbi:MarR family transcriptional regulator [Fusibacter paucivorans]|uniref:MarR family transcriptional regulator n=1 Tax=Fusibacter paucivorans TaxID=76009 RepID=A0ABS5PJ45_9FIRM|nr:MarR family transcriptional regulator [Fusibacter paucivorans]MBS7525098.1 MarR family transcriptional regulator [Fusibacter paucivorans]